MNQSNIHQPPFSPKIAQAAWQAITKATAITLLTHTKPDADGISACAALDEILRAMGKKIEAVYPTPPEFNQRMQPKTVLINEHRQSPDLLIACDTANSGRLYYPEAFHAVQLINIDHHISNSIHGTHNLVNPASASTCELLYDLLLVWDPQAFTSNVVSALLFGILYDSQVFHTQSTTSHTLRVAADLMDRGAQLFELKDELLAHKDPAIIALWGDLMRSITLSTDKKAAWAAITQADLTHRGITPSALVGFNNFLAEIADIDVSILFYEVDPQTTKISFRSKKTDVNALAKEFGGGGHKNAAGATVQQPLKEVITAVTRALHASVS